MEKETPADSVIKGTNLEPQHTLGSYAELMPADSVIKGTNLEPQHTLGSYAELMPFRNNTRWGNIFANTDEHFEVYQDISMWGKIIAKHFTDLF